MKPIDNSGQSSASALTEGSAPCSHTPGPWKANGSRVDGPPAYPVPLIIATCSMTHERGQDAANARLIAAAPDLLHALAVLLSDIDSFGRWLPAPGIKQAREAIKKAAQRGPNVGDQRRAELARPKSQPQ